MKLVLQLILLTTACWPALSRAADMKCTDIHLAKVFTPQGDSCIPSPIHGTKRCQMDLDFKGTPLHFTSEPQGTVAGPYRLGTIAYTTGCFPMDMSGAPIRLPQNCEIEISVIDQTDKAAEKKLSCNCENSSCTEINGKSIVRVPAVRRADPAEAGK